MQADGQTAARCLIEDGCRKEKKNQPELVNKLKRNNKEKQNNYKNLGYQREAAVISFTVKFIATSLLRNKIYKYLRRNDVGKR